MKTGRIEVVCGPMFAGKTEELIRKIRRAQIARQKVQIFKPAIDDRYNKNKVVSHSAQEVEAQPIKRPVEILYNLHDATRLVAIDEVQFFDESIISVVNKLARRGYRVLCAGLDQDYQGVPFGPIPTLLALADEVCKIQAICTVCGDDASKTFRKVDSDEKVLVGEMDLYEARCRLHWDDHSQEDQDFLPLKDEFQSDKPRQKNPLSQ